MCMESVFLFHHERLWLWSPTWGIRGCCEDCLRCTASNLWRKCCDCIGLCGPVSLNNTGDGLGIPSKLGELSGHSLPTLSEALSQNATHQIPVMFMTRPRKGSLKKHAKFAFSNDSRLVKAILFPFNSSLRQVQQTQCLKLSQFETH